jgi:hypothetical protein
MACGSQHQYCSDMAPELSTALTAVAIEVCRLQLNSVNTVVIGDASSDARALTVC